MFDDRVEAFAEPLVDSEATEDKDRQN